MNCVNSRHFFFFCNYDITKTITDYHIIIQYFIKNELPYNIKLIIIIGITNKTKKLCFKDKYQN